MPVYTVRRSVDDTEWALYPDRPETRVDTHDVYDRPMELVAEFWARDWEEAKRCYAAIMMEDARARP